MALRIVLSRIAGKAAVGLKNWRQAMFHRSSLDIRRREAVVPRPSRAMHSMARSRRDRPRICSAFSLGRSTSMPLRISRPSTAAWRKLSCSRLLSDILAPTGPLCWIRKSTAAARTVSMVAPLRIYSSASMPVWRHRAIMSAVRWRSAWIALCVSATLGWLVPAGAPWPPFSAPRSPPAGWPPASPPSLPASITAWQRSNSACSSAVRSRPSLRARVTSSCWRARAFCSSFMVFLTSC